MSNLERFFHSVFQIFFYYYIMIQTDGLIIFLLLYKQYASVFEKLLKARETKKIYYQSSKMREYIDKY